MAPPFTKEQLDLLYRNSEDLVFLMRKAGTSFVYEYVSPSCMKNFKTDLTGFTIDEFLPAEVAENIKWNYKITINKESLHSYRDFNLFSGEKTAYETQLNPIFYGNEIYILAVSKDVSESKEVEEELLFYRSLIDNSVDPMLMITFDYHIFNMNRAYEKTFNVVKEEWRGRPYKELPFVDEETFNKVIDELVQSRAGKALGSAIINRKKSDGTYARFSVRYSPIIEKGEVRAFHIVLRELDKEARLKEELAQTSTILESYKEALNYAAMVAIWKKNGTIQFVNDNFKGTTGYESEELLGSNIVEIGKEAVTEEEFEEINQSILGGKIWRGELKSKRKKDGFFWVDTTIIPLPKIGEEDEQLLSIMFDITDRKELEEELQFRAHHDSLTKLPNRFSIIRHFEKLKEEADRSGTCIAIVYVDGDGFKEVNDLYGHEVGDEFIYQFGQAIQKGIRTQDMVARVGGDEFLIAITGVAPEEAKKQVEAVTQGIKLQLEEGWKIGEKRFSPSASMGVAFYPQDGEILDEIVNKADSALFKAKKAGRNRVLFFGY